MGSGRVLSCNYTFEVGGGQGGKGAWGVWRRVYMPRQDSQAVGCNAGCWAGGVQIISSGDFAREHSSSGAWHSAVVQQVRSSQQPAAGIEQQYVLHMGVVSSPLQQCVVPRLLHAVCGHVGVNGILEPLRGFFMQSPPRCPHFAACLSKADRSSLPPNT
mgnify:CR=1 FL=1